GHGNLAQHYSQYWKVQQQVIQHVTPFGVPADLLDGHDEDDQNKEEHPPEPANKPTRADNNGGWQGQVYPHAAKHVGENRHHEFQQQSHDQAGNTDDRGGVDQCRLHRRLQLDVLFYVRCQTLENGVQNTAGFASLDHVGG